MKRVAIVGGGIAGLAVAEAIRRRTAGQPVEFAIFERSATPGGNIRTEAIEGFLCEAGPNGFLDAARDTLDLVERLGLSNRLLPSSDAARRRFVYRRGRLHQVPGSPGEFLRTRLLSGRGKARLLLEPFARRAPAGDETIHAFAARRLGEEAADVLIDSMVSGMSAGDARQLSLRAAFPRMWELEAKHGGLFRALVARAWEKRRSGGGSTPRAAVRKSSGDALGTPAGRLTSFRGGMHDLVAALARDAGETLRLSTRVSAIRRVPTAGGLERAPYAIDVEGGPAVPADIVVLSSPAPHSARLVRSLDAELADAVGAIVSAPLAVVCVGYRQTAGATFDNLLNGFGLLIPRQEGLRTLGVLWDSSIYSGRAPAGKALIRGIVGGARDPGAIDLDDEELVSCVRGDVARTMRFGLTPVLERVYRHGTGIPQYTVGHLDRLARIDALLSRLPGMFVTGASYRGISMNSCIAEAQTLADTIARECRMDSNVEPALAGASRT
jgi:oxygen-dependent protoporphyrinogen oxidase